MQSDNYSDMQHFQKQSFSHYILIKISLNFLTLSYIFLPHLRLVDHNLSLCHKVNKVTVFLITMSTNVTITEH